MQFLISLAALVLIIYGVISANLLWVLAGVAAVALLSSGRVGSAKAEDASRFLRIGKAIIGPPWRQLLIASLVCSVVAGWSSRQDPFSRVSGYIWLAALALIVASGLLHDRKATKVAATESEQPLATDAATNELSGKWTRLDWGIAVALTLLALGLRLYQLDAYLPPVHGDEGEMGMLALLALRGPASGVSLYPLPFFSTGFLDHPTLFHYLQAFSMMLFGQSITGLRMISVICGALCIPLLYDIGRRGWGRIAGFSAAWLMAVSHLFIQFSRIALNNIETVLSVILLIWLLIIAYQVNAPPPIQEQAEGDSPALPASSQPRIFLFIIIGLVIGLGQYFYYGSRLMPVLAFVLLLSLWFKHRLTLLQAFVVVAAALVAYFPLAYFYSNDLIAFYARLKGVSVFNPTGMAHTLGPSAIWPQDIPLLLWTQVKLNILFFLNYGDHSSFYLADIPSFDQVTVILFWLGLGVALTHLRRFYEQSLLAWLIIGVILAGVLTNDAPNAPRLIVATPALFLICGLFLQSVVDFLARTFPGIWQSPSRGIGYAALGVLALSTLYLNFHTYFVTYKASRPNLTQSYIAQEIAGNAPQFQSYLLGSPNLFVDSGAVRFMAVGAEKYDIEKADDFTNMLAKHPTDKGALLIALPQHFPDLQEIEKEFPQGTESTRTGPTGIPLYVTYQIPAAELTKARSQ